MATMLEDAQLFQVISIDAGRLSYESYGADGRPVDGFDLTRTGTAPPRYTNRAPAANNAR